MILWWGWRDWYDRLSYVSKARGIGMTGFHVYPTPMHSPCAKSKSAAESQSFCCSFTNLFVINDSIFFLAAAEYSKLTVNFVIFSDFMVYFLHSFTININRAVCDIFTCLASRW